MCGCANVRMCEFFSAVSPIELAHLHISKPHIKTDILLQNSKPCFWCADVQMCKCANSLVQSALLNSHICTFAHPHINVFS